jgi:DNA-binding transcriptional ArsR family regulator
MNDNDVSSNGDRWYVDTHTGEIREWVGEATYLLPIDISKIDSRQVYDSLVKERVGKRKFRLWVSPMLLDIVIEKQISIPAISILCLLGQKIGYNNMVYTTAKDISEGSGYVRQTVSSALGELGQAGFVKEVDNKLKEKDSRFLLVNPLYFFLGFYPHRDTLIKDWMLGH